MPSDDQLQLEASAEWIEKEQRGICYMCKGKPEFGSFEELTDHLYKHATGEIKETLRVVVPTGGIRK